MTALEQGVGFDLELDAKERLADIGAIRGSVEHSEKVAGAQGPTLAALRALDTFAEPAPFVFGHNIYWHDLPHLARLAPHSTILDKPAVDTLLLSTIAFADHPYHRLVKDYKLVHDATNNPVADARIAGRVLADCRDRFRSLAATNPTFVRVVRSLAKLALRAVSPQAQAGTDLFFAELTEPSPELDKDLRSLLGERACSTALDRVLPVASLPPASQLPLLFAVAWLRVAGTTQSTSPSVVMPWARRHFPALSDLLHQLRDVPCGQPSCTWCRTIHDPVSQLRRWFDPIRDFRTSPTLPDGRPAQPAIVVAGFANKPLLALLPTGGGKSLCFQLPAINRYVRRGSLTIVISPLQSLMHDQVDNFRDKTRTQFAYALTGRLTPPERRATLDAVRSGEAGILYASPEQLRNSTFKKAIALREIGAWVFDEAHCLSKWGHDFRPDYLYAARFVKELQGEHAAPIVCVTATAKQEVRDEILGHFKEVLGQELLVFDGHAPRPNLTLKVEEVTRATKLLRLRELVAAQLASHTQGSVLVYTATRGNADLCAKLLLEAGIEAASFHAGLESPKKKQVQEAFLRGQPRVVCATNAFGMGIDKPDIRLVLHFDLPGSLEAYVQEVGRAGRDGLPAEALLLFVEDDAERQFRLAASSRLTQRDVRGVLHRIRNLSRPVRGSEVREAVCTTGEILQDEQLAQGIEPSERGAPTRVVAAIAWLERGKFLSRDENATTVFQGRPLVRDLEEAARLMAKFDLPPRKAAAWTAILTRLMNAEADDGFSSDDFLGLPEVIGVVGNVDSATAGRSILRILLEMQKRRLLSSGVLMTAFVTHGVVGASTTTLQRAVHLESRLLEVLREQQPDLDDDQKYRASLRQLTQELALREPDATLDLVRTLLDSMAERGMQAGANAPGLRVHFTSRDECTVQVQGTWDQVATSCRCRHRLADSCLAVLLAPMQEMQTRGKDLLSEFALEDLVNRLHGDVELHTHYQADPVTAVEYALLFLHRIRAIVLHKGLAVFRQAMVLRVPEESRQRKYVSDDFAPLAEHQDQRTTQVHVMREFAVRMQASEKDGLRLLDDYFTLSDDRFLDTWFKGRRGEIERATSPASWQRIVKDLSKEQRGIVEAKEDDSLLVLAGPGSGKTRVVVHRCAYLLRVKRVPARAILVLCFNRSASLELRSRLFDLVGEDAHGVLVQTYHGMAARLVGRAPAQLLEKGDNQDDVFAEVLQAAIAQLEGKSASNRAGEGQDEQDDLRDRLLAGFRHILVDEYQDIDELQYRLVSAIAGRTQQDADRKLTVLAVGDDDQNIYQWRGSNVEFLRRFEVDYQAKRLPLVENFRSTAHILSAANQLIAQNRDRMKIDAPIAIDARRAKDEPGGRFASLDPIARGQVQVLELAHAGDQPDAVLAELQRLRTVDPQLNWETCAVLSPRHAMLAPVRTLLEQAGIPVRIRIDREQAYSLFRLREVQTFLTAVGEHREPELDGPQLRQVLVALRREHPRERGFDLVQQTLEAFLKDSGEHRRSKTALREFFGELLMEQRRERTLGEGVMLGTVHGSKGAEYDHVLLLDGDWRPRKNGNWEEQRRLYYVGMTRARQTLTLLQSGGDGAPWLRQLKGEAIVRTSVIPRVAAQRTGTLHHELLSQTDLFLAFAGRASEHQRIASAIDSLATGDALRMVSSGQNLLLQDSEGVQVGALSKSAVPRWRERLPQIQAVRVAAVVIRRLSDEGAEYQDRLRRSEWQVVIPEVAYSAGDVMFRPL
jgi:ATP-dependent DNA helicase RecQ